MIFLGRRKEGKERREERQGKAELSREQLFCTEVSA